MFVEYELSSQDVNLTLDLLADNESIESYILSANESVKWIPKPNAASAIKVQFTASRYLVSTKDYEYALVFYVYVAFLPCTADTGKFLCLYAKPT